MSIKNRTYRQKHGGLSPYMTWLLCGFILGHKYFIDPKNKKLWQIKMRDGSELRVHTGALKSLIQNDFIYVMADRVSLRITNKGFPYALDRIRASGVKPVNSN